MLDKLVMEYNIIPAASVMLGDQNSDMIAADLAKIGERILITKDERAVCTSFTKKYDTLFDFYQDKFLIADLDVSK